MSFLVAIQLLTSFPVSVDREVGPDRLGRAMYRKLKVYAGTQHPHEAQQPQPFDVASAI